MSILKALAFCILLASSASHSGSAERYQLNVESQTLEQALRSLANASGRQLLFPYDQMEALKSISISGRYTLEEALGIILKDTSLSGELTTEGVILVTPIQKKSDRGSEMNSKKKILAATIGLFMGGAGSGVLAQEASGGEELDWLLEEVVVTANKRGEATLQDTAMAISVLSDEVIAKRGLVEMKDYLNTLPGVSYIEFDSDDNRIIFRGLSLGGPDQQTTSGAYLGEMPMSSASKAAFDIKLVDIERIEVLRGPQGTLYGSSALGGTVRNIPVAPNLENLEGSITADFSTQSESGDTNQSVIGIINIPLVEDQLALRVATYHYNNAGYIDAISTPEIEAVAATAGMPVIVENDINGSTYKGARASMLWHPSENLELNLILGTQKIDIDGSSYAITSLGGYQTQALNSGGSAHINDTDYANLVVNYDFSSATLTSSTSVVENKAFVSRNLFAFFPNAALGPAQGDSTNGNTDVFSQELRLVSDLDGPMQFLAGLFYEDVERTNHLLFSWNGSNSSENVFGQPLLLDELYFLDYQQKAIFGEVSYKLNEQWEVTLGGRHFDYDRKDTTSHPNVAPFNPSDSQEDIGDKGETYKVNVSFTPNDDTLIYLQWSEGFRLGRGQGLPPTFCDANNDGILDGVSGGILTPRVDPDTTENIELGAKLSLLNNRLNINTALFSIDWSNLPVEINPITGCRIINNIGEAHTQGIEFEANYAVSSELQIDFSASYTDAEWTDARAPVTKGESLVYSPRVNASMGLQYNFDLGDFPVFVRTDISYIGEYETSPRQFGYPKAGDYTKINLRAGLSVDQWSMALYATNLTNYNDFTNFDGGGAIIATLPSPRKIGLEISYSF